MLNKTLRFSSNQLIDVLIKVLVGVLLLSFLSPIQISEGLNVPITLQSMLVVLIPIFFGSLRGGLAVFLYLMLGGLGLPVFANGASGWNTFTGVSGGFLFGFLFAAVLVGYFAEKQWKMTSLAAAALMVVGQFIILFLGLFWMENVLIEDLDWFQQLEKFVPGLMIKAAIGMLIYVLTERLIRSAHKSRELRNS